MKAKQASTMQQEIKFSACSAEIVYDHPVPVARGQKCHNWSDQE